MAFLERVGEGINNVGNEVSRFAKGKTEAAKLHAVIVSSNNKMAEQYQKIGKVIYEKYKGNDIFQNDLGDTMKQSFLLIEEAGVKKKEAQDILAKSKGGITCPDCETVIPKGSAFCSKCGRSLY